MVDEEPSINIPSLLTLAVVSFFVIRWFLSRDGSSNGANGSARARGGRMIDPAQVEQISQMFPQLNRRDIMWDLQRNGGSVAATTERILTGRGLDNPPLSYQPQIPQPATPATTATPTPAAKSGSQDLISRYNLSQRISEEQEISSKPESAWSQNKSERQRLLQKRRDDMILAARRKLQQKDREASHATGPAF
ncbi:AMFR protein, putative [Talaromyces stipitatus ATCC 10500]|uniref:Coupling of ubiquitin conjugation to ER degradation protein 1 n=1 Tax=Talaromyces stipitatus (strain ATCC 10500 / CBS 375.48 / QM 6759 / NRRL 1006) TaxID=441959 RepID=B8M8V2_TALSN|nr:AMFR protein, putative [Talaromyces stipitatus ATCC 10500]EED20615.1 AMFR protein, putative [Talaromyces stipitatus ATCC 10500]